MSSMFIAPSRIVEPYQGHGHYDNPPEPPWPPSKCKWHIPCSLSVVDCTHSHMFALLCRPGLPFSSWSSLKFPRNIVRLHSTLLQRVLEMPCDRLGQGCASHRLSGRRTRPVNVEASESPGSTALIASTRACAEPPPDRIVAAFLTSSTRSLEEGMGDRVQ